MTSRLLSWRLGQPPGWMACREKSDTPSLAGMQPLMQRCSTDGKDEDVGAKEVEKRALRTYVEFT